jgi:hypothetical protein
MCGLLASTRSARKPYTKGASSVSSVTGSQENLNRKAKIQCDQLLGSPSSVQDPYL